MWQREAVHKQHVLIKDKSDPIKIIKPRLDTLRRQRRKSRKANKKHDKSDAQKQYIFCSQCCVIVKYKSGWKPACYASWMMTNR